MTAVAQTTPDAREIENLNQTAGKETTRPTPTAMTKSRRLWRVMTGGAALFFVLVWILVSSWRGKHAAPAFETSLIQRGDVQSIVTATGNLNPVVNVQVGSQVSGNIVALYADFNTQVRKGQLVARIDPALFQAQVDSARATFRQQQENRNSMEALVAKAEAEVGSATAAERNAEAILAKDEATLQNLRYQWVRQRELYQQNVTSKQDHDSAEASFRAAEAQVIADRSEVDAAKLNMTAARAENKSAVAQLHAAAAQMGQAHAVLDQAEINLQHTQIVTPVSGTVIARHFDVGQTVAASFQAPDIFDIGEDLTKMQVDTNVDEADVGAVHVGQAADFTVDAFPSDVFHGQVADVRRSPITAQNVVTYDVVITVANPYLKLFPGMTAKVTILTAKETDVLKVPNASLRYLPSADVMKQIATDTTTASASSKVYVLRGQRIVLVPVSTGLTDGRFTAISSNGLKEGDVVILRKMEKRLENASTNSRVPRL